MDYKRLPFEQYYDEATSGEWTSVKYYVPLSRREHSADFRIQYDKARNCIQLVFQCTSGIADWLDNFNFGEKYYDEFTNEDGAHVALRVCRGWARMYKMMKWQIRQAFINFRAMYYDAHLEIIGYSLGSAMAQLAAQDLHFNYNVKSHLYTFGSVKPFAISKKDRDAVGAYLKGCCESVYNIAHRRDIVGRMPPFPRFRAINRVLVGTSNVLSFFNAKKWHGCYGDAQWYEGIV